MLESVKFHEELGVYVAQYSGRADLADIRQAYAEMAENPKFRPGLRAICDLRAAELDLSGEDIRMLAALVRAVAPKWGKTKWLAVVASDVSYGLLRMFITLTDRCSISTLVVRKADDAGDWLDLGVSPTLVLDGPLGGSGATPCAAAMN